MGCCYGVEKEIHPGRLKAIPYSARTNHDGRSGRQELLAQLVVGEEELVETFTNTKELPQDSAPKKLVEKRSVIPSLRYLVAAASAGKTYQKLSPTNQQYWGLDAFFT